MDPELEALAVPAGTKPLAQRLAAEERARRARALLPSIVACLRDRFGATRIVLFGSLVRGDFGSQSDIDLLVSGIQPEQFFHACAAVDALSGEFFVDIAPAEKARPFAVEAARDEGEVLLDAG
jgi:predicted nucleotidyltransferase